MSDRPQEHWTGRWRMAGHNFYRFGGSGAAPRSAGKKRPNQIKLSGKALVLASGCPGLCSAGGQAHVCMGRVRVLMRGEASHMCVSVIAFAFPAGGSRDAWIIRRVHDSDPARPPPPRLLSPRAQDFQRLAAGHHPTVHDVRHPDRTAAAAVCWGWGDTCVTW